MLDIKNVGGGERKKIEMCVRKKKESVVRVCVYVCLTQYECKKFGELFFNF